MMDRFKRPSPALVVGMIALFVALGGTAGAVATATVPLAKRALMADNAKKVNGLTANQIATAAVRASLKESPAGPRPASSVAGLMTTKTATASLPVEGESEFSISCDAGQKVAGGGFSSDGAVFNLDSFPSADNTWRLYLVNAGSGTASITLYATCLR